MFVPRGSQPPPRFEFRRQLLEIALSGLYTLPPLYLFPNPVTYPQRGNRAFVDGCAEVTWLRTGPGWHDLVHITPRASPWPLCCLWGTGRASLGDLLTSFSFLCSPEPGFARPLAPRFLRDVYDSFPKRFLLSACPERGSQCREGRCHVIFLSYLPRENGINAFIFLSFSPSPYTERTLILSISHWSAENDRHVRICYEPQLRADFCPKDFAYSRW